MSRTLIVFASLLLVLGCQKRKTPEKETFPALEFGPDVAVTLLTDTNVKDAPVCLDALGSDGKRLTVGRYSSSQAAHEAGRFYFGVFNSAVDATGKRRVSVNRTYFTDAAMAVQSATLAGARQFQVCKFGEI